MLKIDGWISFHRRWVVFAIALFIASSLSFAAGYAANRDFVHAPIIVEKCSEW